MKKINFKQPKYILPLIASPFVLMIGYFVSSFTESMSTIKDDKHKMAQSQDISTDLGGNKDTEIKGKADAYQEFFDKRTADGRTMISEFEKESEQLDSFDETLSLEEKRHIDSLNYTRERERLRGTAERVNRQQSYYTKEDRNREDLEYERSMKMLEMLNGGGKQQNQNQTQQVASEPEISPAQEQMALMREQMMLLDSIEKANNPELKAQAEANEVMKKQQQELDFFLNSTLDVTKATTNGNFNSVHKVQESSFIKAVIDENIKGYLGSRLRIRLLEDIYVGKYQLPKGTVLYALISGFSLQRVNLQIVSVMHQNDILPINLSIYDVDGMEGLYVPASAFREMTRTMGQNVVQGQNLSMASNDFFTNALTSMFQSTSRTIAELIRKNKVKVKYNTFVYLIDNRQQQRIRRDILKTNQQNYQSTNNNN